MCWLFWLIVLATGLVVDDGIVVTEKHFQEDRKREWPSAGRRLRARVKFYGGHYYYIAYAGCRFYARDISGRFCWQVVPRIRCCLPSGSYIRVCFAHAHAHAKCRWCVKILQKTRLYLATEPFSGLDNWFRKTVTRFLDRWPRHLLLSLLLFGIYLFSSFSRNSHHLKTETGWGCACINPPKALLFESTDALMDRISQFIGDLLPKNRCV